MGHWSHDNHMTITWPTHDQHMTIMCKSQYIAIAPVSWLLLVLRDNIYVCNCSHVTPKPLPLLRLASVWSWDEPVPCLLPHGHSLRGLSPTQQLVSAQLLVTDTHLFERISFLSSCDCVTVSSKLPFIHQCVGHQSSWDSWDSVTCAVHAALHDLWPSFLLHFVSHKDASCFLWL